MIWWFLGFQIHKNVILRDASLAVSFPGSFFSISAVKRSLPGELFYSRLFSSLKGFILECLLQVFCKTAQNLFAVFIPSFFYCSCEGQFDTMSYDTCLFLKNFTSTIKKIGFCLCYNYFGTLLDIYSNLYTLVCQYIIFI